MQKKVAIEMIHHSTEHSLEQQVELLDLNLNSHFMETLLTKSDQIVDDDDDDDDDENDINYFCLLNF